MAELTVAIKAKLAEAEHSERAELAHALYGIAQALGDGMTKSGELKSRDGRAIGSWSYTPAARA